MPSGVYSHKRLSPDALRARAIPRFWARVAKRGLDDCWEWVGVRVPPQGRLLPYGLFSVGKKLYRAHRFSYEIAIGPIPDGLLVLHKCDNPPCVNPAHLYAGTYVDNMRDRTSRGRSRIPDHIRAEWAVERKARYEKDPELRGRIAASTKRQWAAGVGIGSPMAQENRTAGIRRAKLRLAKAQKG